MDEAEAFYDESSLDGDGVSPGERAESFVNRANQLQRQGHSAHAVARYNSAIPLLEEAARMAPMPKEAKSIIPRRSPPIRYADCLTNRAAALRDIGLLSEAVASY